MKQTKVSKTPNKDQYLLLCKAIGPQLKATLVLCNDATWHIVRKADDINGCAVGPRTEDIQQIWHGWEGMLRMTTRKALETLHKGIWPDIKIGKTLATNEALCVLIWNYRCSKAKDWTVAEAESTGPAKNPLQRASSIAGRTYRIITPSKDAKPYKSPAAMKCLAIIKEVCGEAGICTEGQLKPVVVARGLEITPTAATDNTSAWRFLQFYRPLLVEAELISYTK